MSSRVRASEGVTLSRSHVPTPFLSSFLSSFLTSCNHSLAGPASQSVPIRVLIHNNDLFDCSSRRPCGCATDAPRATSEACESITKFHKSFTALRLIYKQIDRMHAHNGLRNWNCNVNCMDDAWTCPPPTWLCRHTASTCPDGRRTG